MSLSFVLTIGVVLLFVRQFFGKKGDSRHIGRGVMVGVLAVGAIIVNTSRGITDHGALWRSLFVAHILVGILFFICLLATYLTGLAAKRHPHPDATTAHFAAIISTCVFLFWTVVLAVSMRFV